MKLSEAFIGALLLAEAYKRLVPEETKARWQGFIKSHHGEWGALGAVAGLSTGSAALTGVGLGLVAHDWPDKNDWFETRKF